MQGGKIALEIVDHLLMSAIFVLAEWWDKLNAIREETVRFLVNRGWELMITAFFSTEFFFVSFVMVLDIQGTLSTPI